MHSVTNSFSSIVNSNCSVSPSLMVGAMYVTNNFCPAQYPELQADLNNVSITRRAIDNSVSSPNEGNYYQVIVDANNDMSVCDITNLLYHLKNSIILGSSEYMTLHTIHIPECISIQYYIKVVDGKLIIVSIYPDFMLPPFGYSHNAVVKNLGPFALYGDRQHSHDDFVPSNPFANAVIRECPIPRVPLSPSSDTRHLCSILIVKNSLTNEEQVFVAVNSKAYVNVSSDSVRYVMMKIQLYPKVLVPLCLDKKHLYYVMIYSPSVPDIVPVCLSASAHDKHLQNLYNCEQSMLQTLVKEMSSTQETPPQTSLNNRLNSAVNHSHLHYPPVDEPVVGDDSQVNEVAEKSAHSCLKNKKDNVYKHISSSKRRTKDTKSKIYVQPGSNRSGSQPQSIVKTAAKPLCTSGSRSSHLEKQSSRSHVKKAVHTPATQSTEMRPCVSLSSANGSLVKEAIHETQHGLPSKMALSVDASFFNLVKTLSHYPVICLLKRDFITKDHLFPQWRSTSISNSVNRACAPDVGVSSSDDTTTNGKANERTPKTDKATEYLHIPDYTQLIQLLPLESPIPTFFVAGIAYFKMFNYKEAQENFKKCEDEAIASHRDGDVMLCNAYLGDIEYSSQNYLKAAHYYEKSIKHYTSRSVAVIFKLTAPTLSAIHAKRASSFRNASRMVQAVKEYRIAIDVAQTDRDRLSAHTSLGNLYQSMGENSSALAEYKQSIELANTLSDQVSLGWAHGNIGNAYLGLNRKDEAVHHLQKSLDLAVEYERTPQAIGRTYNNLGTAYQSMNDLDKAEEYYDLALSQAVYGNDIAGQARVYGNIGNVHMLRKNYERAIPHYSEVLRLSSDPATISTARHNRGCAYYEWATSLLETSRKASQLATSDPIKTKVFFHGPDCDKEMCLKSLPTKAKELFKKGSIDLAEVVKHHEERFQHIKGSSQGLSLSVSLFESNSRTFHRLQDCLANLHEWDKALVIAEKSRARTLGELMLKRKEHQLVSSLDSPLSFEQIANIVKNEQCPIVYLSYTGARLIGWVFVLCSGEFKMNMFEVPLADDQFDGKSFDYYLRYSLTEKLVERSFEMYEAVQYDDNSSTSVKSLYELVAAPVATLLEKQDSISPCDQVICISDSYTSLLPLTCLFDQKTGTFFGDRHYFRLAPSLLSLGIMSQLPEVTVNVQTDQHDFCVVGDPDIPPFNLNEELWTLGKLPYARKEAEWVAHALQTTPILSENASKTALLSRSMKAKIIHIATHGSASVGFLAFSTFFTPVSNKSRLCAAAENVLLYPKEVEKLNISPALVVLSSCDSGRGTVKADGIQGMARAFILAGAQSVLTTLWKIPDESASVFMQFFYQYLIDGLKSSYALHKAILSVRCFAKYSQYIHWSGYQLTGRDIVFSTKLPQKLQILRQRLGIASVFPQLNYVKQLEKALVSNPVYPTDVQFVQAAPGIKPSEVVIDFITSFHQRFSAGVFWINCHHLSLLTSSIDYIEKVIGSEILELPISESQQALFVLDGLSELSNIEPLVRLIRSQFVHVIALSRSCEPVDKLIKEIDRQLVRGCKVYSIRPLTVIHSAQRIVYSLMKGGDFTPTNDDQQAIEKLAEYTAGSPVIVDITSQVLPTSFHDKKQPLPSIEKGLLLTVNSLAVKHNHAMGVEHYGATMTRSVSENVCKLISNVVDGPGQDVWATSAQYDSWDSVMILVDNCDLSSEERLLLNCLSVFSCSPIPYCVVTELASLISISNQKPHIAGTLHSKLLKYHLLCTYPYPVVLHSSLHLLLQGEPNFVHVPQYLSQCIWKYLMDIDQITALTLVYHVLLNLQKTVSGNEYLFCAALCPVLLEAFELNFTLVGKESYQEMYSLSLTYH